MAWRPTGSAAKNSHKARRFWIGIAVWGGGMALVWVGAAFWRMVTIYPPDYVLVLSSGLFYAVIVGRILVQPRTEEGG
jgi:cellulose synthase (UDP-forming)